jgi:hypothetical protein
MSSFSIILLTISSSFFILLIDEQLRLPCRLLVLLLTISSSSIILLIDEQLRLPWRLISLLWHWMPLPSCGSAGRLRGSILGAFNTLLREHTACLQVVWDRNLSCGFHASLLVLYCSRLAVLSLYCSLMSSCDLHVVLKSYCSWLAVLSLHCSLMSSCNFHVVLYLYSCIRCHSHTPVGLCCYESSMRPHKVFLATSCQLYLGHHCQLDSSSHRTTCGITGDLNRRLVGRLAASSPSWLIFIVASLPLPHSWGIMLLWNSMRPYKVFLAASCRLWLRHHANFACGITADLIRRLLGRLAHHCLLELLSRWTTCGVIAVLIDLYSGIIATSTLLW